MILVKKLITTKKNNYPSYLKQAKNLKQKNNYLNMSESNLILNKVKKRLLILSPTVKKGIEPECRKEDFSTDGIKPLGKGGYGEVWKVFHRKTKNVYVIKVIEKELIIEQDLIEQMNREIDIMYKINHPHIVKLVNHFEDDQNFYLVLDFASKGPLYTLLKKQKKLDEVTAAQFIRDTLEAVKYLHSFNPPIIHRDIKPENLLLDENFRIKLADFGWSNFKDSDKSRITFCGTPDYLSPEMVRKLGHDATVDIWSIGVLLFELIAGYAPFSSPSQEELFNNIKKLKINWPSDFPFFAKNLIKRILKINPKERMSIDDILNHTWFEKNPPNKPLLKYEKISDNELLRSFIIDKNDENSRQTLTKMEEEKVNRISIINKTRMQFNSRMERDSAYSRKEDSILRSYLKSQKEEFEILYKENFELKEKINKIESEFKSIRLENLKLKEIEINFGFLKEENLKNMEEIEKFKILNQDRLDLLSELEEKNNLIFDLRNEIRSLENEKENLIQTESLVKAKIEEMELMKEKNEILIEDLKNSNMNCEREKEEITFSLQKKLEIMQLKFFSEENEENDHKTSFRKFAEILNESINDLKAELSQKISDLIKLFSEIQEKNTKSEESFINCFNEKNSEILDVIQKVKESLEDDILKTHAKINTSENTNNSKSNEIIEWYKKQVQELNPYKTKFLSLEGQFKTLENSHQMLNELFEDYKIKNEILEKTSELYKEKINQMLFTISDLEAKNCDIKNFFYSRMSDEYLEEFHIFYNHIRKN